LDPIKDPNPLNFGANTPLFVNGPGNDFYLAAGSPAIGSGKAQIEPVFDFFGNPFAATARAIGAVELKTITQVITADKDPILLYPNPATDFISVLSDRPIGKIEVWNTLGMKVIQSESAQPIFIGDLPTGVYYLNVEHVFYPFVKL
jgi:hypothetical protein